MSGAVCLLSPVSLWRTASYRHAFFEKSVLFFICGTLTAVEALLLGTSYQRLLCKTPAVASTAHEVCSTRNKPERIFHGEDQLVTLSCSTRSRTALFNVQLRHRQAANIQYSRLRALESQDVPPSFFAC